MKLHKLWILALLLPVMAHAKPKEMRWEDLIPDEEKALAAKLQAEVNHSMPAQQMQNPMLGKVRADLNNKKIRIPGFVVPLEGDDKVITEFLLVPYFGACIHLPPPPANQLIYVRYPKGAPIDDLWGAIWLEGTLKAEPFTSELAQVGYQMDGLKIEIYE